MLAKIAAGLRRAFCWISSGLALLLSPLVRVTQAINRWADERYPSAIGWALTNPWKVIGSAVALFVATMVLIAPRLGTELIPQMSQGEFNVDLRLPPGAPLEQTDRVVQAAQRSSTELGNVALAYSVAGTGNRLDANPVDAGENTGRLSITLQAGAGRDDEDAAMAGLREGLEDLAGVQYRFSRPSLFSLSTPLEVVVSGYDLDRLQAAAEQLRTRMMADDRFADVKTTVEAGNPEIQIVFDQERAAQLGLVVREIADRVVNSVRGEVRQFLSRSWKPQVVMLSGDTDCYQPIERKLEITRRCLEVFLRYRSPVMIVTKNGLIQRDIDILKELAALNLVLVTVSITSLNADLIRTMEPRTSAPTNRLETIEVLAHAGIPVGVSACPIIPALNDEEIPAILREAAARGASYAGYTIVRLPHAVKDLFVDWLKRELPDRARAILNRIRSVRSGGLTCSDFGKLSWRAQLLHIG